VGEIWIMPTAADLADAAADRFATLAASAVAERGRFTVALSGGSTPEPVYRRLAREPWAESIDWARVEIFWGDERCVPPNHPNSNFGMVRRALLDPAEVPTSSVHRIRGEHPPFEAARAYEQEIGRVLGREGRFDLVLLGMGSDGHTASLFPGTSAVSERDRAVVPVWVDKVDAWRVTLTLPVINSARDVIFLVRGSGKADAVSRVVNGEALPATRVDPRRGKLTWLLDADAAAGLPDELRSE